MSSSGLPLEVELVADVKACRTCKWFWDGSPPYGPYPSFDWLSDFPPEVVRTEKQSGEYSPAQPWLSAKLTGTTIPDPGIMHGCRKAPIMTIGINPNLTAWFPYTSSASWIYPGFTKAARFAYYYRHFTLYQESLSLDYVKAHLSTGPNDRLIAEDDFHAERRAKRSRTSSSVINFGFGSASRRSTSATCSAVRRKAASSCFSMHISMSAASC